VIYAVIIPALLLFMPWVLVRYVFVTKKTSKLNYRANAEYLWLAAGVWVLSQLLPRVSIYGQTDTFIMHTLGGVVAAILFVYTIKSYKIEFEATWQLWVGLFLFVSALGVLNELFEFFLYAVGVPGVVGGDEWWDLTANTLGSFAAYGGMMIFKKLKR
jgi:glycopeptide antibiotics resistance protein